MLNGAHGTASKKKGKELLHHHAVGEHVGDAARNAKIIFQHREIAVRQAHDVGPDHGDIYVAVDLQTAHLAAELPATVNHFARDDSVGEDVALVVHIAQKQIQRGDALGEAALYEGPLVVGNDARQQVVRKNPLGAFVITINGEGYPLIEKRHVRRVFTAANLIGGKGSKHFEHAKVMLADGIFRREHLVVGRIDKIIPQRSGTRRDVLWRAHGARFNQLGPREGLHL